MAGTATSSRMTSRVSAACQPIFGSGSPNDSPGAGASTRNVLIPRRPASGAVFAATISTSARPALVMNILRPFSRYPAPSRTAELVMAATSEPEPGSVTASAATLSPRASPGR